MLESRTIDGLAMVTKGFKPCQLGRNQITVRLQLPGVRTRKIFGVPSTRNQDTPDKIVGIFIES